MNEETKENQPKEKNTAMAAVAYLIFFLPLLTDAKDDQFVKYHVKQGLIFFISAVVVWIFGTFIPIIGWILIWPLNILLFLIWIFGILHAVKGEEKPLPLIGKFAEKFNL